MRSCVALAVLLAASAISFPAEPENPGHALLLFPGNDEPRWVSLEDKWALESQAVRFVDVTSTWADRSERRAKVANTKLSAARLLETFPAIAQQDTVKPLIENLSTTSLEGYLTALTAFTNRHYNTTTGRDAAVSIYDTAVSLASAAGRAADVSVSQFEHRGLRQPIEIDKIP